jgi:uncharacterized membrane protein YccF (DUF307 family)
VPTVAAASAIVGADGDSHGIPASSLCLDSTTMNTVLNLIWLVLSGFWLFLSYMLAGIICCILIVTIPFGIASFRIGFYALWPFGRRVVSRPDAGVFSFLGNVIWVIVAGIWIAIEHILSGIALCITIIGIPLGIANFKMVPIALMPLGKEIVDAHDPRAVMI